MRNAKARRGKRALVALGLCLLLSAADYLTFSLWPTAAPPLTLPSNGAWLSFDYAAGKATETPAALGARFRANHLRDAYFHVRYIGQSGRLRYDIHETAHDLNRQMARDAPHVRRFAWLFIGNERAITGVDLSQPDVRARIVQVCRDLTEDGFDGIQIDYEICADGDADFLVLLREVRAAVPGKVLSVATPLWLPVPIGPHGWSEPYFAKVVRHCDQITVMAYDSALYSPRGYEWLMRAQVRHVARATEGTNCHVVIGVPTYRDGGLSHDPRTENLANALRGVRDGLEGNPYAGRVEGVAVFADYTTDVGEWDIWRANVKR